MSQAWLRCGPIGAAANEHVAQCPERQRSSSCLSEPVDMHAGGRKVLGSKLRIQFLCHGQESHVQCGVYPPCVDGTMHKCH